jgi:hypothetical protein
MGPAAFNVYSPNLVQQRRPLLTVLIHQRVLLGIHVRVPSSSSSACLPIHVRVSFLAPAVLVVEESAASAGGGGGGSASADCLSIVYPLCNPATSAAAAALAAAGAARGGAKVHVGRKRSRVRAVGFLLFLEGFVVSHHRRRDAETVAFGMVPDATPGATPGATTGEGRRPPGTVAVSIVATSGATTGDGRRRSPFSVSFSAEPPSSPAAPAAAPAEALPQTEELRILLLLLPLPPLPLLPLSSPPTSLLLLLLLLPLPQLLLMRLLLPTQKRTTTARKRTIRTRYTPNRKRRPPTARKRHVRSVRVRSPPG